ncbi:MAG: LysM peptidoglycan-binding domain-containing protein [Firmicutes bacterium]|nr:LysM peptidoglycan-binding domain-containing protein [Bacillota bacterium]
MKKIVAGIIVMVVTVIFIGQALSNQQLNTNDQEILSNKDGTTIEHSADSKSDQQSQEMVNDEDADEIEEDTPEIKPVYKVKTGDYLGLIAAYYGISVNQLMKENEMSKESIYPGDELQIPQMEEHIVRANDTLYSIAKNRGTTIEALRVVNQLEEEEIRYGDKLWLPKKSGSFKDPNGSSDNNSDKNSTVSRGSTRPVKQGGWSIPAGVELYYVKAGDTIGAIARKFGTTSNAIKETNRMKKDLLQPDQALFVPVNSSKSVHGIEAPQVKTVSGYGEMMHWEYANWHFPSGAVATVKDIITGKSFKAYRIGGGNHTDCEPLTKEDTAIMKSIYGGRWSWQERPVLVQYDGRVIAASMGGMPHAFDTVSDNNFNGMFDLHFLDSRRHKDNREDPDHQAMVRKAAGY